MFSVTHILHNASKTTEIQALLDHAESLVGNPDRHYTHIEGESILIHTINILARDSGVEPAMITRLIDLFVMELAE